MSPFHISFLMSFISVFILHSESATVSERVETLHPRYEVKWSVNLEEESVEFAVTAETKGYVGLGLSYNGGMTGADIVIGGVDQQGEPYFKDYHGTKNGEPTLDSEQNWELLKATESENFTFLQFKRIWDTCDDQDIFIDKGTIHLIWSFGETDEIKKHDFKGSLAVNLLDPPSPPVNLTDVSYEISTNYTLNGNDTAYWCSIHKRVPKGKTHIIAFQPKLETPEALEFTHHFNVYFCRAPEGQSAEELFEPLTKEPPLTCFDKTPITNVRPYCQLSLYAWSFGGRLLVLPEDVGFPWGEGSTEYYYFETHVNNPKLLNDITFQTGVKFYDTDVPRPNEAGMMALAYATSVSLFIPPATTNWTIAAHGSSFCTEQYVPPTGVNLFNVNLHAHISAKTMKFRHFRNGTELPWIAHDDHYDFNYQENRPLRNPVKVLPRDHLTLECVFDSTWKEIPYPVIGGYPSTDEMCMVFAFYYPKINIEWFSSVYPANKLAGRYGITNLTSIDETFPSLDPKVILPEEWAGQTLTHVLNSTVSWTSEEKDSLQQELRFGMQKDNCPMDPTQHKVHQAYLIVSKIFDDGTEQTRQVGYPEIKEEYTENRICTPNHGNLPNISIPTFFFILFVSLTYSF